MSIDFPIWFPQHIAPVRPGHQPLVDPPEDRRNPLKPWPKPGDRSPFVPAAVPT